MMMNLFVNQIWNVKIEYVFVQKDIFTMLLIQIVNYGENCDDSKIYFSNQFCF